MRFRPLHLALLAFEILWLGVIVPGHRRGSVPLAAASCCHCAPGKTTPARSSGNCAICFFTAHLMTPPVIDLSPAPLLRLHCVRDATARSLASLDLLLPFHGRAPPACA